MIRASCQWNALELMEHLGFQFETRAPLRLMWRGHSAISTSALEVAAFLGEVRVPGRHAGAAAIALGAREARLAAGAAEGLVQAQLQGADLRDGRDVDALLVLRLRGAHAVAVAVLVHDLVHGLLADKVALVDHELTDAARANLHEVQAPAVAGRRRAPGRGRGGAAERRRNGQVPHGRPEER